MVLEVDQKDFSVSHVVGIPVELYQKRTKAGGEMKNLSRKCRAFRKETRLLDFQPLVKIVVAKKSCIPSNVYRNAGAGAGVDAGADDDDDSVCRMDRFWKHALSSDAIVNTELQYDYTYKELKDEPDRKVVVIPLERFLEGYLFAGVDPYPLFTENLERVLDRTLGGWIGIHHLFGSSSPPDSKVYLYPNPAKAVAKFLDLDKKDDRYVQQLVAIKELIGFDAAHVRANAVFADSAGDKDDDGVSHASSVAKKPCAVDAMECADDVPSQEDVEDGAILDACHGARIDGMPVANACRDELSLLDPCPGTTVIAIAGVGLLDIVSGRCGCECGCPCDDDD